MFNPWKTYSGEEKAFVLFMTRMELIELLSLAFGNSINQASKELKVIGTEMPATFNIAVPNPYTPNKSCSVRVSAILIDPARAHLFNAHRMYNYTGPVTDNRYYVKISNPDGVLDLHERWNWFGQTIENNKAAEHLKANPIAPVIEPPVSDPKSKKTV